MLLRFERGYIDSLQYTPPSNIISVGTRYNLHPWSILLSTQSQNNHKMSTSNNISGKNIVASLKKMSQTIIINKTFILKSKETKASMLLYRQKHQHLKQNLILISSNRRLLIVFRWKKIFWMWISWRKVWIKGIILSNIIWRLKKRERKCRKMMPWISPS